MIVHQSDPLALIHQSPTPIATSYPAPFTPALPYTFAGLICSDGPPNNSWSMQEGSGPPASLPWPCAVIKCFVHMQIAHAGGIQALKTVG